MMIRYFAAVAAAAETIIAPAWINAVVMDEHRPKADTDRDAARKPAEVLTFSGLRRGDKVIELIPGGGYFTRLLSLAVGPRGHVTEVIPNLTGAADVGQKSNGVSSAPHFANVTEAHPAPGELAKLGPADVVWTSQNYHDLHLARFKL